MNNKLVDICVNLTDDVFLGKEKHVIDEANKIYDVETVIPAIYLASELSRNKL